MSESSPEWDRLALSKYRSNYRYGRGRLATNMWAWLGGPLIRFTPHGVTGGRIFNWLRILVLRMFGAKIGQGVVINPCSVLLPWHLEIGDDSWVGSDCEIYNLAPVKIGRNVCISQRVYLCTGNHDYSSPTFELRVGSIEIKDSSWVCAATFIAPGVTLNEGSVATAGSIVTSDVPTMAIVRGNPAVFVKRRVIRDEC